MTSYHCEPMGFEFHKTSDRNSMRKDLEEINGNALLAEFNHRLVLAHTQGAYGVVGQEALAT